MEQKTLKEIITKRGITDRTLVQVTLDENMYYDSDERKAPKLVSKRFWHLGIRLSGRLGMKCAGYMEQSPENPGSIKLSPTYPITKDLQYEVEIDGIYSLVRLA